METKQRSKSCDFNPAGQKDCSICILEFEKNSIISSPFECGHRFHRDCINAWISRRINIFLSPNCAYCKSEVLNSEYSMNIESKLFDVELNDSGIPSIHSMGPAGTSTNENYDNPPQRPDSVPKIYPLFPTERKRQILMESRNNWARYFNQFNNYNRLTKRRRSEGQINRDSVTLRECHDVVNTLSQMLNELND